MRQRLISVLETIGGLIGTAIFLGLAVFLFDEYVPDKKLFITNVATIGGVILGAVIVWMVFSYVGKALRFARARRSEFEEFERPGSTIRDYDE